MKNEKEQTSIIDLEAEREQIILRVRNLSVTYSKNGREFPAFKDINLDIAARRITAIMGPSGSGKSTLIRSFNRMNEIISGTITEGSILFAGTNLYEKSIDPVEVRRRIGMVFQKPNPFPKTIYENVAWGARINGFKGDMDQLVKTTLVRAALWDEVKDDYKKKSGTDLSGGQQQRLCIARAIAVKPDILLMDEPCSALDPVATAKIERLIEDLRNDGQTVVIVTHNKEQATRIADYIVFICNYVEGSTVPVPPRIVEYGRKEKISINPVTLVLENFLRGKF